MKKIYELFKSIIKGIFIKKSKANFEKEIIISRIKDVIKEYVFVCLDDNCFDNDFKYHVIKMLVENKKNFKKIFGNIMKKILFLFLSLFIYIDNVYSKLEVRFSPVEFDSTEHMKEVMKTHEPEKNKIYGRHINTFYVNGDIKCISGDVLHINNIVVFSEDRNFVINAPFVTFEVKIGGIEAFNTQSQENIDRQKKISGLSLKEIKKREKLAKIECEEYFIKNLQCTTFNNHGVDEEGRFVVVPCHADYEKNLVKKGLATIYKGDIIHTLIFGKENK